ncbi:MAG: response regulator transcription factor [Sphaerochaetaceae bacterium]|nr:response regulator transcription factor [Sphaerochaetaceae bacterium]
MRKILLIEDELGVQITLEDRLIAEGYQVTIKDNGIDGENEAINNPYNLILLDVMLPMRDGFTVCKNLREKKINTPIIMLTARNTNIDVIMGLNQGADDYVMKPFDMGVLLARIDSCIRRNNISSIEENNSNKSLKSFQFGKFTLDKEKGALLKNNKNPIYLNAQEFRLLEYFINHPNQLLDRNKILDDVWGYDSEIYTRTVDVHIAKLRAHLGESQKPYHIRTVRGLGYKFIP